VAAAGRLFAWHLRSYDDHLVASAAQAIRVARETGCRTQISHLQAVGPRNWGGVRHVLDLVDAAMGPIVRVVGTGDPLQWVCLTTEHESGALGQIALSITTPGLRGRLYCEVFTDEGTAVFDGSRSDADPDVGSAITTALAVAVETGEPNPIDVHRGLYLQRLLEQAQSTLH
jgi:hypothetical protein